MVKKVKLCHLLSGFFCASLFFFGLPKAAQSSVSSAGKRLLFLLLIFGQSGTQKSRHKLNILPSNIALNSKRRYIFIWKRQRFAANHRRATSMKISFANAAAAAAASFVALSLLSTADYAAAAVPDEDGNDEPPPPHDMLRHKQDDRDLKGAKKVDGELFESRSSKKLLKHADKIDRLYCMKFEDGMTDFEAKVATVLSDKVKKKYSLKSLNGLCVDMDETEALTVAGLDFVKYVEEVVKIYPCSEPWGLDRIDQGDLPLSNTQYDPVGYPNLGAGTVVYVIDGGIRPTHVEFGFPTRAFTSADYDFVGDGKNGIDDCSSDGHGTHCAGTAAGETFGVAPGANVVAVRVIDCSKNGHSDDVEAGINKVLEDCPNGTVKAGLQNQGKRCIVSISLAAPGDLNTLNEDINSLVASGIPTAVAAANYNTDACAYSPARAENATTVGATTRTDDRRSDSNYGSCVDVFAPGDGILSANITSDTANATMGGTSMATPHVAGVAALILGEHPTLTAEEVEDKIIAYALVNKISDVGAGSPNKLLHATETQAVFVSSYGSPACLNEGINLCDSGHLLEGRANLGPEPNQPNTIDDCPDGEDGNYQDDERLDRLKVYTVNGENFAPGVLVEIEATVWAIAEGYHIHDRADFYYANSTNSTNSPDWQYIGTVAPPDGGAHNLAIQYNLPAGDDVQAVRVNFRYDNLYSSDEDPCAPGVYNDRDDLVFAVPSLTERPSTSPSPSDSPTDSPSDRPSTSLSPSGSPTASPSENPSDSPSAGPSENPSDIPSASPSGSPSDSPSGLPTVAPSTTPSYGPACASAEPDGRVVLVDEDCDSPELFSCFLHYVHVERPENTKAKIRFTQGISADGVDSDGDLICSDNSKYWFSYEYCNAAAEFECNEYACGQEDNKECGDRKDFDSKCYKFQETDLYYTQVKINVHPIAGFPMYDGFSCETALAPQVCTFTYALDCLKENDGFVPGALSGLMESEPTSSPTDTPTRHPTSEPSESPSQVHSDSPTAEPSNLPSDSPSHHPSMSRAPSSQPVPEPTASPSITPTSQPSVSASDSPSPGPGSDPSSQPSSLPSLDPSGQPSSLPSLHPTLDPTTSPSDRPSLKPSDEPSGNPTVDPSGSPSSLPSVSFPPTESNDGVCSTTSSDACMELVEESCSATSFSCFEHYVQQRTAEDDKSKIRVQQRVNEVGVFDPVANECNPSSTSTNINNMCCPDTNDPSIDDAEYQMLYTRIKGIQTNNGVPESELECKRRDGEKCGWKADFDSRCTVNATGDFVGNDGTHTEVEVWFHGTPNAFDQTFDSSEGCNLLRSSPDASFCYFKYRFNCSQVCDPR